MKVRMTQKEGRGKRNERRGNTSTQMDRERGNDDRIGELFTDGHRTTVGLMEQMIEEDCHNTLTEHLPPRYI